MGRSGPNLQGEDGLHRRVVGEFVDVQGRARVLSPLLAEHFDEKVALPVHHPGRLLEAGRAVHVALEAHGPHDAVQIAGDPGEPPLL